LGGGAVEVSRRLGYKHGYAFAQWQTRTWRKLKSLFNRSTDHTDDSVAYFRQRLNDSSPKPYQRKMIQRIEDIENARGTEPGLLDLALKQARYSHIQSTHPAAIISACVEYKGDKYSGYLTRHGDNPITTSVLEDLARLELLIAAHMKGKQNRKDAQALCRQIRAFQ
jgi:hypothetical protein